MCSNLPSFDLNSIFCSNTVDLYIPLLPINLQITHWKCAILTMQYFPTKLLDTHFWLVIFAGRSQLAAVFSLISKQLTSNQLLPGVTILCTLQMSIVTLYWYKTPLPSSNNNLKMSLMIFYFCSVEILVNFLLMSRFLGKCMSKMMNFCNFWFRKY
jgi:hypothetical protein